MILLLVYGTPFVDKYIVLFFYRSLGEIDKKSLAREEKMSHTLFCMTLFFTTFLLCSIHTGNFFHIYTVYSIYIDLHTEVIDLLLYTKVTYLICVMRSNFHYIQKETHLFVTFAFIVNYTLYP